MPKEHTARFHKNYIKAIRLIMADNDFATFEEAAEWAEIGPQSLYKIMNGKQAPTTEQGIELCLKGGFSANWMFLGVGAVKIGEQATLNAILKEVRLAGRKQ